MKRKISNPLALAVLGLLQEQPMHPYEMAVTLRERYKGDSFKVTTGSLYDLVQALERDGWIEARETVRDGKRPERTVYALTELGQREFVRWVDELVRAPINEYPKFIAAIAYLGVLSKEGATSALRERAERLLKQTEETEVKYQQAVADWNAPRLFMIEVEYAMRMARAELEWIDEVIAEIADGTLPWPGDDAWTFELGEKE